MTYAADPRVDAYIDALPDSRVVVVAATGDLLLVIAVLAEGDLADREHPRPQNSKYTTL